MCKSPAQLTPRFSAPLAMPEARNLDPMPFTHLFQVRHLDMLVAPRAPKVDPAAGQPFVGAEGETQRAPQGATGEAAVALWTWLMGPPPRCA